MMMKRGEALRNGEVWDQIKYEMAMKKHIQDNMDDKMTWPREAYITFYNEEGFQRAIRMEIV